MAANKMRRDGTMLFSGLSNIDPAMQKPAEEKPIEKPIEEKPAPQPEIKKEPKAKSIPAKKKRAPGRPRKFKKDEETVVLGIRVKKDEASFLEIHGGLYGGKTGYVTHLIREEMKRVNK